MSLPGPGDVPGQAGRVYDQWRNCVGVEMAALIEGSASVLLGSRAEVSNFPG